MFNVYSAIVWRDPGDYPHSFVALDPYTLQDEIYADLVNWHGREVSTGDLKHLVAITGAKVEFYTHQLPGKVHHDVGFLPNTSRSQEGD